MLCYSVHYYQKSFDTIKEKGLICFIVYGYLVLGRTINFSQNYKKAQIKLLFMLIAELIKFYYELGEEISKTSFKASYRNKFYKALSDELIKRSPNTKGLSQINIRYAERFYILYKKIFPQVVEQLLLVPWGHYRIIIDKCKSSLPTIEELEK